jgi:hypothetical protein
VPVLERLQGLRVVADPGALDGARWVGGEPIVLRFAPDDALGIGARSVELDDAHAIVETETGFVGACLRIADVAPHLEWTLPAGRPVLAQGSIAGVPAKLWIPGDGDVLLLTAAAFAHELTERLG